MQFSSLIIALAATASANAVLPRASTKELQFGSVNFRADSTDGTVVYSLSATDGNNNGALCQSVVNTPIGDQYCPKAPEIIGFSETLCNSDYWAWSLTQQSNGDYNLVVAYTDPADSTKQRLEVCRTLALSQFECAQDANGNFVRSYTGPHAYNATAIPNCQA